MHGADAPAYAADVRRVRDRPTERRARCLRAPASLLCVGCRCDVQCGAMRVDALGAVPPCSHGDSQAAGGRRPPANRF